MGDTCAANDASCKADNVRRAYLISGVPGAESLLKGDAAAAIGTDAQHVFQKEVMRLQAADATSHVLRHIALDWAAPLTADKKITTNDLEAVKNDSKSSPFDKLMAQTVESEYNLLANLGSAGHDVRLLWPGNWGSGIMRNDIDRVNAQFDGDRLRAAAVKKVAESFLGNDGALFKKLANGDGAIGPEELRTALDPANPKQLNDQELKAAKWAWDNWSSDSMWDVKNLADYGIAGPGPTWGMITQDTIKKAVENDGVSDLIDGAPGRNIPSYVGGLDGNKVEVAAPPPEVVQTPVPPPEVVQTPAPPPEVVQTPAPPPEVVQTPAPPPEVVQTPVPPPEVVQTPAPPPEVVQTTVPPPEVVQTPAPPPEVVQTPVPPPEVVQTPAPPPEVVQTPVPPPEVVQTPVPPPEVVQTPAPPPEVVQTPVPPPEVVQTPAPPPEVVQTPAPPPEVVQTPVPPPEVVQTPAPPPEVVQTPAPPLEVVQTPVPPPEVVQTPAPPPEVVQTPAPPPEVVQTPVPPPEVVQTPAPPPEVVQTPAPPPEVVQTPVPPPEVVQTPAPPPEVVEAPAAPTTPGVGPEAQIRGGTYQWTGAPPHPEQKADWNALFDPNLSLEDKVKIAHTLAHSGQRRFTGPDGNLYEISTAMYGKREAIGVFMSDARGKHPHPMLRAIVEPNGNVAEQRDPRGQFVDIRGDWAKTHVPNHPVLQHAQTR